MRFKTEASLCLDGRVVLGNIPGSRFICHFKNGNAIGAFRIHNSFESLSELLNREFDGLIFAGFL